MLASDDSMTLAYFCLGALDLLGLVQSKLTEQERLECIDWVYAQQLDAASGGGFMPGPFLRRDELPSSSSSRLPTGSQPNGNLAMTYTAIINLAILRDDFSRLDLQAIRTHLAGLQQPDGR